MTIFIVLGVVGATMSVARMMVFRALDKALELESKRRIAATLRSVADRRRLVDSKRSKSPLILRTALRLKLVEEVDAAAGRTAPPHRPDSSKELAEQSFLRAVRRTRGLGRLSHLLLPSNVAAQLLDELRDDIACRIEGGGRIPRLLTIVFVVRVVLPLALLHRMSGDRVRDR